MIPLVSPTITDADRQHLAARAYDGGAFDERTVREFEEAFAERVGCAGAVAVCSGTEALRMALSVLRLTEAATMPTYACSAVFNAVAAAQAWVHDNYLAENCLRDGAFEVRSATMNQDQTDVLVHAFGTTTLEADALIEDYTLSLGGIPALAGQLGVCSTHASKMLSTGRGGVVFSNDSGLLDEVRRLAYYDSEPNGRLGAHSLGMTSMQAALGLSQLRQLDSFIARRREIAAAYSSRCDAAGIECPAPDCGSVFFRYLIAVDCPGCKVNALAQYGIEAGRGVFPPLHRQLGLPDDDFPGATWCVNHLLSVPCHPSMSDADVAFVAEKVLEVCA